jgi:AP-3 complex subunit mu
VPIFKKRFPCFCHTDAARAAATAVLDLSLTPRLSGGITTLNDLAVELYLGHDQGISAVRCDVARGLGGFGAADEGNGGGGIGGWSYDPRRRVLRWEIGTASSGTTCTLRGSWSAGPDAAPRPARALQVTFGVPRTTFSALKIDQLKVTGEAYKPYKGMRGRSTGKVEWRI